MTPDSDPNHHPPEPTSYAGLPSYGSFLSPTGEEAEVVHVFACGDCEVPSPNVRRYSLLTIIFAVFVIIWRSDEVMKCPRCMRRHILVRLPLAVLLSNVFSPAIVLWWLVVFVQTFFSRPG